MCDFFQDHNLGAKFHRSIMLQPQTCKILQEFKTEEYLALCLERSVDYCTAETTIVHSLCTGVNELLQFP